jgi:hypothetical protein
VYDGRPRTTGDAATPPANGLLRRTSIECGPLRITREYHVAPVVHGAVWDGAARPPRRDLRFITLLGILCTAGIGGLAVAATKGTARGAYSITLPVPVEPTGAAAIPVRHANPPRRLQAATRRQAVPPALAAAVEAPPAATTTAGEDLSLHPTATATRRSAIAAALRDGEVQEWRDPATDARGYVVAGAAETSDGRTCRALSVLTRSPGGVDAVEQRRDCLPPAKS